MAKPKIKNLPKNTWIKVATNATSGMVWALTAGPVYLHTYRPTGQAAPTSRAEGVKLDESIQVYSSEGIDVYVMAAEYDGKVRVDV